MSSIMQKCATRGININGDTALTFNGRCEKCYKALMDERWAQTLREFETAGINRTRESTFEFVYNLFSPSDAREMVQKVILLGHSATLRQARNKFKSWEVRCKARLVPTRENLEKMRASLCDVADDYQNWFLGWGVSNQRAEPDD
jgi:hypothetical protein